MERLTLPERTEAPKDRIGALVEGEWWPKVIIHVDMDAFFAAVEIRNRPALRGLAVIVGGPADSRGVVSSCSYEARRFGIHSGMPMAQAMRLCPEAVIVQGSLDQYGYISAQLIKILLNYTPLVEPISVDEAFMDVTSSLRIHGSVISLANTMKKEIEDTLQLTCTCGIGPTKIISKMTSQLGKPNGLVIQGLATYRSTFAPRPTQDLWGVGEKTAQSLRSLGICTIGQLAHTPTERLQSVLGKSGVLLQKLANGADEGEVRSLDDLPTEKSISHETTFPRDSSDPEYLRDALLRLAEKVGRRLRKSSLVAHTISVKIRTSKFKTITRDFTLVRPSADHYLIFQTAVKLLELHHGHGVLLRLVGVKAGNLVSREDSGQLSLFQNIFFDGSGKKSNGRRLGAALDSVRDRFGEKSIDLATMKRHQ